MSETPTEDTDPFLEPERTEEWEAERKAALAPGHEDVEYGTSS